MNFRCYHNAFMFLVDLSRKIFRCFGVFLFSVRLFVRRRKVVNDPYQVGSQRFKNWAMFS
jgi:hypothetical protein